MSNKHRKHNRAPVAVRQGLKRWQKNIIHGGLLVLILVSLWHEGGGKADWGFFLLSIITEVS